MKLHKIPINVCPFAGIYVDNNGFNIVRLTQLVDNKRTRNETTGFSGSNIIRNLKKSPLRKSCNKKIIKPCIEPTEAEPRIKYQQSVFNQ